MRQLNDLLVSYKLVLPEETTYTAPQSKLSDLISFVQSRNIPILESAEIPIEDIPEIINEPKYFYTMPDETPEEVVNEAPEENESKFKGARNYHATFKGRSVSLNDSINIATQNAGKYGKHLCTRAVANALLGITDTSQASGVKNPQELYTILKNDGWEDVYSENYVPQEGDVYTIWGFGSGANDMHSSIFANGKFRSNYNEHETPFYWDKRYIPGTLVHIMRRR